MSLALDQCRIPARFPNSMLATQISRGRPLTGCFIFRGETSMPARCEAREFEIVAREDFSDVSYLLEVRHPMLARAAQPGQFVIVMSHAQGERIPLTIADFDRLRGTITLVIQAAGKTTRQMQQTCRVGTRLHAVVGQMGWARQVGGAKKVVCEAGGVGV